MNGHNEIFRDAVMIRTYCRELEDRKETPDEVWERVLDAFQEYYSAYLPLVTEIFPNWRQDWKDRMSRGKALPAGRMIWSMGSAAIKKDGYLPMMNCAFIVLDEPVEPLKFIMKLLMLGCGVGFSLEDNYFYELEQGFNRMRRESKTTGLSMAVIHQLTSTIDFPNAYVIEDTKEGWVDFLEAVVMAAIKRELFYFSTKNLRPAGSRIKGFGGRSGDPQILANIAIRIYNIISNHDCSVQMYYDVICSIGELVISGNVRRSALIAIGDPWDNEFLELKRFSSMKDAPWRSYCNNSVNVSCFEELTPEYWSTYTGDSEAYGWVNVAKCQKIDREKSTIYVLPQGFNPCGEQPLASREVCCLSEVNLSRVESFVDLFKSVLMCYFFCKFSFLLGCSEKETRQIVRQNQRIGISLTGIAMVQERVRKWAYQCRKVIRLFDKHISAKLSCNPSVALTTVKPGGTLPKIAGSSGPGIHRPISEYQIRRVRFNRTSSLVPWLQSIGVPIEPQRNFDGAPDPSGTQVASFYLKNETPSDGCFSSFQLTEFGFIQMLHLIAEVQEKWSDNAISVTVYYHPEKVETLVKPAIGLWFDKLKVFSGLPYYGHNFPQAPEEPIEKEAFYDFFEKHAVPEEYSLPLTSDDTDPEDFGQCDTKGLCSDR